MICAGMEGEAFDTAGNRRCHGCHRAYRGEGGLRGLRGGAREAGRVLADSASARSAGMSCSGGVHGWLYTGCARDAPAVVCSITLKFYMGGQDGGVPGVFCEIGCWRKHLATSD